MVRRLLRGRYLALIVALVSTLVWVALFRHALPGWLLWLGGVGGGALIYGASWLNWRAQRAPLEHLGLFW